MFLNLIYVRPVSSNLPKD
uniref:Uncharacterized protein n=1 Tax=Rhizophora mucronata TaxID=61149 RepID=A0A2P2NQ86_RHIMU